MFKGEFYKVEININDLRDKKIFKYSPGIVLIIVLTLTFILGNNMLNIVSNYLKDITIIGTFLILVYIYFFQLIVEVLKNLVLYCKDRVKTKRNFNSKDIFNFKFLLLNFGAFLIICLVVLGCSLFGAFFSGIKILFIVVMVLLLSGIYLIYTVEFLNMIEYNFKKYDYKSFKNKRDEFLILILINGLIIIITSIMIKFFLILMPIMTFIILLLSNFILCTVNVKYMEEKF